jgi:hypothetical protein
MKKEEVFIDDGSQLRAILRPSDIGSVVGWFLRINTVDPAFLFTSLPR